jgi:DNA-nicking Smr family endonuclease
VKPRKPPPDTELWERVAETVAPLDPGRKAAKPAPVEEEVPKARQKPTKPTAAAAPPSPLLPAVRQPPALAPLDRRLRTRLGRGAAGIDARIDLHGLTQSVAHRRLISFLHGAQADGAKLVLVITGKGRAGDSGYGEDGRGVLRRMVPVWLSAADLRSVVIGFETAGRAHGGDGALYVRIRRRREA